MTLARRALAKREREDDGAPAEEPTPVPPWLRRVTLVLSLVNVAVLAYLWRRAVLEGGLFVGAGGLASALGLPDMEVLTAPALFNWVFGGLAVMAGLGALGLALWSALGDRLVPEGPDSDSAMPAVPLRTAVEESLDDLRAEGIHVAPSYAATRGSSAWRPTPALERRPWLTPTEFMREVLARLSLPRAAVPTLTGLFELARFSHHPLGASERDRAVDALHEIRRATAPSEGDAGG